MDAQNLEYSAVPPQNPEAERSVLGALLQDQNAVITAMETLKAQGKEKSATYRQYLGNRLFYNQLFAMYRQYGLIGQRRE